MVLWPLVSFPLRRGVWYPSSLLRVLVPSSGDFSVLIPLFFIIVAILANLGLTLVDPPGLVLIPGPLPPGGCDGGGGIMPAGTGSGPDGGFIKCITIGSGGTLDWDLPLVRAYVGTLIGVFLGAFPPPIIIGCDAPPGGGGGCPSFETSIRTSSASRRLPFVPNSVSRAT